MFATVHVAMTVGMHAHTPAVMHLTVSANMHASMHAPCTDVCMHACNKACTLLRLKSFAFQFARLVRDDQCEIRGFHRKPHEI